MPPTSPSRHLLEAGPYRTLLVVVLAALAVGAIAIPRYRAAIGLTPTERVNVTNVPAPLPTPLAVAAAPTESPSPTADVTRVPDPPVSELPASAPVTAQPRSSGNKAAEARVTRKEKFDWNAATTRVERDRAKADASPARSASLAATVTPAADSPSTAKAETISTVTINGCLEISVDGGQFRLTDTEGSNVPKARSWRSGFLKKQTAAVELLEIGDPATARQYVGQRVAATGVVDNREMRVRSLQASGSRCE